MLGYKGAALVYIYVHLVAAREYCYTSGFYATYCEDDYYCCDNNTQCCPDSDLTTAVIVGIVIGSLCFLACVVGLIVFICKKSQSKPGTVVSYPQGQATISSIQSHHYGPQFGAQPPAYGHSGIAPPAYQGGAGPSIGSNQSYPPPAPFQSQGNAAYPPPAP